VVYQPFAPLLEIRSYLLWRKDKTRLRLIFSSLPSPGGLWFDALRRLDLDALGEIRRVAEEAVKYRFTCPRQ
jgi:hypothetical protein